MKNGIILCLYLVLLTACTPTKQLPTDGGAMINISGSWNATDAAIIASQLKETLLKSSWYEKVSKEGDAKVNIYIQEVIYQELEEPFDKSLKTKIHLSLSDLNTIKLLSAYKNNSSSFELRTFVKAFKINSFNQQAIQYKLLFKLVNEQQVVVWSVEETLKKYISE
jgi:rRNA-processing protein FCF1